MGAIASALIGVFSVLFGLIANIAATITGAFLALAVTIFNWVTSGDFISLSYTGLDNPFIATGWDLTRGLTNIFFVIALLVIGLGTALRITGYRAQKALPVLIIIALLINFTPVILGLIVDAANIVMNFFIQDGFAGGNIFVNLSFSQWGNIGSLVKGAKFWDPTASNEAIAAAAGSGVLVVFNFVAALIYFLFAFLFIFRYVAIWTLVILSPFAFASYILPATRGIWSQWWKQFIQWSIIGVVAAFFLYLGEHFITTVTPDKLTKIAEVATAPGLAGIFNSILPYFIALAFLAIGLFMALNTSAAGASQIMDFGQKAGKAAGRFVASQTLGRALATERGKRWMQRLEETKMGMAWKGAPPWRKALTLAGAPIAYPLRWGLRAGATAGLAYGAKQDQLIEDEKDKIKRQFGKDFGRAAATFNSIAPTNWQRRIAMGRYLAETKGAKALDKLSAEQYSDVIGKAARYTPARLDDIVKHTPELIDEEEAEKRFGPVKGREMATLIQKTLVPDGLSKDSATGEYKDDDVKLLAKEGIAETELVRKTAFKKAVDAMKSIDLETASVRLTDNPDFQEAVARWKPWNFIHKMFDEWGSDISEKLQAKAEELDASLETIARTNPSFFKAPYSPGGRMFLRQWKYEGRYLNQKDANLVLSMSNVFRRNPILSEYSKLGNEIESLGKIQQRLRDEGASRSEVDQITQQINRMTEERDNARVQIEKDEKLKSALGDIERIKSQLRRGGGRKEGWSPERIATVATQEALKEVRKEEQRRRETTRKIEEAERADEARRKRQREWEEQERRRRERRK